MKKQYNRLSSEDKLNLMAENVSPAIVLVELAVSVVAVVIGLIYLYGKSSIPIGVLMPIYSGCFIIIAVLKFITLSRAKTKKPTSVLFALVLAVLAVAITAVTVMYFLKK